MATDSHACLDFRNPEPCDDVWHPYAVCFIMLFGYSLPIAGLVIGILKFNASCPSSSSAFGLQIWLLSFSLYLLCYETYFLSNLPAYWSNLYARLCSEKIRTCGFYACTALLFLWWCAGWIAYTVDSCQSNDLGVVTLVVLLVSMIEAIVVGCFCFVAFQVKSWIRDDHPSNRSRNVGRDTDPLLNHFRRNPPETLDGGTHSSQAGIRSRISAMISEHDRINQRQATYASASRTKVTSPPVLPPEVHIPIRAQPEPVPTTSTNIAPISVEQTPGPIP